MSGARVPYDHAAAMAGDAARMAEVKAKREHVRRVRSLRADMRRQYSHARRYLAELRTARTCASHYREGDRTRSRYVLEAEQAARRMIAAHAGARAYLVRLVTARAEGAPVPRGMMAKDTGHIWANQGARVAEVLAVRDGLALIAYGMPAGRVFYWQVSAALEWEDLNAEGFGRLVTNVSATKPAKRWAADVARYNAACGQ